MFIASRVAQIIFSATFGVVLVGIALVFVWFGKARDADPLATVAQLSGHTDIEALKEHSKTPTLYCSFYNLMRTGAVVSFDFAVDISDPSHLRFSEMFVEEFDISKTAFGETGDPMPVWSYTVDDGTPTLTSPDAATKINLYGLKPQNPGVLWGEAGIRSNDYKNLEGKCRQAYFH